jgi:ribosomal protein S18 acetylase RimI-like enzyme
VTEGRADGFTVRPTFEGDWREVRALRLEMLQDTPLAFLETVEAAREHPDEFWRGRARSGSSREVITLAAIRDDGRWVGTMTGRIFLGIQDPYLLAVYVAPDVRGPASGVADALLGGIEDWARGQGTGLLLDVHEDNSRARAFYERRGFVETGRTKPYPLDPRRLELEMRKELG